MEGMLDLSAEPRGNLATGWKSELLDGSNDKRPRNGNKRLSMKLDSLPELHGCYSFTEIWFGHHKTMLKEKLIRLVFIVCLSGIAAACNSGGNSTGGPSAPATNETPIANAGTDQTVNENTSVTLNGSGTDRDGTIVTYSWTQTEGPSVTITPPNAPTAGFTAPEVTTTTQLSFSFSVTDNAGAIHSDSVRITIRNTNPPPTTGPSVSNVTGNLNHGSSVTINGTGFGNKRNAAPVKWDNFESGALGAALATNGWIHYSSNISPLFSNTRAYSGNQSAHTDMPMAADNFNTAGLRNLNTLQLYLSCQFRWERIAGDYTDGPFIKLLRANANPDFYHSRPRFYTTHRLRTPAYESGYSPDQVIAPEPNDVQTTGIHNLIEGQWNRLEVYYKYSDPAGTANGALQTWVNLGQNANYTDVVTRANDSVSGARVIDNFLLPFMADRLQNVHLRMYVDDVYVDTTQARVEIGNAPTWDTCTQREIQIPSFWSTTAINITVNRGMIPTGSQVYLYVVDSNGNHNTSGYPVQF